MQFAANEKLEIMNEKILPYGHNFLKIKSCFAKQNRL